MDPLFYQVAKALSEVSKVHPVAMQMRFVKTELSK